MIYNLDTETYQVATSSGRIFILKCSIGSVIVVKCSLAWGEKVPIATTIQIAPAH